ncbi:MAG: amino acid permease [Syntrophomonadaceae bacterium]|nr:amino acid permease [Syntrophomonadaceae bacterium]
MENQGSGLQKSLSKWSVLSMGLGCVIGWSWIIYAGYWGSVPGTFGGVLAFVIAGLLCSFVGLVYAELTAAFPRAGGDVVFVFQGLGEKAAILAGWCIMLLWTGLIMIEAMMLPVIMTGLGIAIPKWGYLWEFAGGTVYLSYFLVTLAVNLFFAYINYRGAEISGKFQTASVFILLVAAIFFFLSGVSLGDPQNVKPLFTGASGLTLVMLMVPGFLSGFNAVPQIAEEANMPPNAVGRAVVLAVWGSVLFYILIIVGLSFSAPIEVRSAEGLAVVNGIHHLFKGSTAAAGFVTFAALLGMLTTWNAAYVAASRLMVGLSRAKFIPGNFHEIHSQYGTPYKAIWTLFFVSTLWALVGTSQVIYVGIVNVSSFFLIIAWATVIISFMRLRKKQPDLERPYRVPFYRFIYWSSCDTLQYRLSTTVYSFESKRWIDYWGNDCCSNNILNDYNLYRPVEFTRG